MENVRIKFTGYLLALGVLLLGTSVTSQNSIDSYYFAYITQTATELALIGVNPSNPTSAEVTFSLPIPTEYGLEVAHASPDGNWIILVFARYPSDRLIQIYHVSTGNITNVAQLDYYSTVSLEGLVPLWSPDSRFLAFNGRVANAGIPKDVLNTYVYQLDSGILETIKTGTEDRPTIAPYALVWSPDNTQLAIFSRSCRNLLCDEVIEIYAIPSAELVATMSQNEIIGNVCQPEWSSDKLRIAYSQICDIEGIYFHEIYLWNIPQASIAPLTNFTNSPDTESLQSYNGVYDFVWYDTQTLLAGIATAPYGDSSSLIVKTSAYAFPEGLETQLLSTAAYELVKNPVSQDIAFRNTSISSVDALELVVQDAITQIVTFDGQTFSPVAQGSAGCELQWSPDGKVLGYLNVGLWDSLGSCGGSPEGFFFINAMTGENAAYDFPPSDTILPVGWIAWR